MASVTKEGNKYYIRLQLNGKEYRLRGFLHKREAVRVADKLEQLKCALTTGTLPADISVWVSELGKTSPKLLQKIAEFGLLPSYVLPHTLSELLEAHNSQVGVEDGTRESWQSASRNMLDYFGEDRIIDTISVEDADKYCKWLHTACLNCKRKVPVAYAPTTAIKRLGIAKEMFAFAERLDWLQKNPFRFQTIISASNPDALEYVPIDTVNNLLEHLTPRWAAIVSLCRFAGVRGASELYRLEWQDIHWSTPEEPGWVSVRTKKNKRHGRVYRVVPMYARLEKALRLYQKESTSTTGRMFPEMKSRMNFSTPLHRFIVQARITPWKRVWYNLRKSFCSDMLERIVDVDYYESITDHSYRVALRHYSIMHRGRVHRGEEQARLVFRDWDTSQG